MGDVVDHASHAHCNTEKYTEKTTRKEKFNDEEFPRAEISRLSSRPTHRLTKCSSMYISRQGRSSFSFDIYFPLIFHLDSHRETASLCKHRQILYFFNDQHVDESANHAAEEFILFRFVFLHRVSFLYFWLVKGVMRSNRPADNSTETRENLT